MLVEPNQYTGPKEFVQTHSHTNYSSLDGVPSAEQYADVCVQYGHPAMAATEHGHMASVPDMHFAFKKRGLKFIPGVEIYLNQYEPLRQEMDARGEKLKGQDEALRQRITRNRHLTVLAKNAVGFTNLLKLTTLAWKWGFYYKPRIWLEKLCEYKEGLIVLSGCVNGPLSHEIRLDIEQLLKDKKPYPRVEGRDFTATQYLKKFKEAFGEDFFIEVQMPCLPELHDVRVFWKLIELADKHHVRAVLTGDVHYINREDAYLQKVMMAIDQKTTVYDPNLFQSNSDEQYFKTRAELWATFKNGGYSQHIDDAKFEEICNNTLLIAERCEKLNPDTSPKIPSWSIVEPGVDANQKLRDLVHEELRKRGWDKDKTKWFSDGRMVTYAEQAELELNRFIDKGFASYFLITWDLMSWGKSQGWPFGPRGCTIPDSAISMANGEIKKIENVQIGDNVLDGFGDIQIVEDKFVYDVSEELFVFELDSCTIAITADHKLYITRDDQVMILPASEIKDADEIIGNILNKRPNYKETTQQLLPSQIRNISELQILVSAGLINAKYAISCFCTVERLKIKSISRRHYVGKVFDLQVSNTNTYKLNGIFSSNSVGGSFVCYLLGIHCLNSLKFGLSMDRFMASSRGGYLLNVNMGN